MNINQNKFNLNINITKDELSRLIKIVYNNFGINLSEKKRC